MAFNLSTLFRPAQQSGQPQQQQQQQQQQSLPPSDNLTMASENATPGTLPQPNDPSKQSANNSQAASNTPLDDFKDLWHTDPKISSAADPWSQPLLPSDPTKIREAASKMNMLDGVSDDVMQRAMSGSDPKAFMEVINHVGQNALAMSAQLSSATVERAGLGIRDRINGSLENQFKQFQLKNLPTENPALNHPAAQPLLKMTMAQIGMSSPDLSPQQIHEKAVAYLQGFASSLAPKQQAAAEPGADQDWEKFVGLS